MNAQRQLLALLDKSFSSDEIRALLINLGVDPDSLVAPNTGRTKLAQETILHFKRRKRLADLAAEMQYVRPDLADELAPFLPEPSEREAAPLPPVRSPVAPVPLPENQGVGVPRPWAKPLLLSAGVLTLILLGWLAFQTFYIPPDDMEANNIIVRVFDAETREPLGRAQVTFAVGGYAPRVEYSDTEGVAVIQRLGAQGGGRLTVQLEGYEIYEYNLPDDLNTAVDVPLERND